MYHFSDDEYFSRREQESLRASAAAKDSCARRAHAALALAYHKKKLHLGEAATAIERKPPFPSDLGKRPLRSIPVWAPAPQPKPSQA